MFKKVFSLILITILSLYGVLPITAYAVPPVINNPRYQYVDSISTDFNIISGVAYCYGSARTNHSDTTTTIKVTLDRKSVV